MVFSNWVLYVTATLSNTLDLPVLSPINLDSEERCMFTDSEGRVICTFPVLEFWLCRALTVAENGERGTWAFHCKLDWKVLDKNSCWLLLRFCWKFPEEPKLTEALKRVLGRARGSWLWFQRTKKLLDIPNPGAPANPCRCRWKLKENPPSLRYRCL